MNIMPEYQCELCKKTFDRKYNYNLHLNRKFPCIGNSIRPALTRLDILDKENKNMKSEIQTIQEQIDIINEKLDKLLKSKNEKNINVEKLFEAIEAARSSD